MPVSLALRMAYFGGLWIILTEGEAALTPLGAGVVALATAFSIILLPRGQIRPAGLPSMLGLLARIPFESLKAGTDVAVRALHPNLPIRPALVRLPTHVGGHAVQVGVAYLTTILPGTICVQLDPGQLRLHLIDRDRPVGDHVALLEGRLAASLGGGRHG